MKKRMYKPGAAVPQTLRYRNTRTGKIVKCIQGTRFPPAPKGSVWVPMTWHENAFWSMYDFLAKHSVVFEALGALLSIMTFVTGLIRRSFVVAIIVGVFAFMFVFALLVRITIRSGAGTPVQRRVFAALGAFLLLSAAVLVALWGMPKLQHPLFPPAAEEEILIVVAEFEDRSVQRDLEIQRLIIDRISLDLAGTELENVRLEKAPVIEGDDAVEAARKMGEKYRAAIVIWGWYDDAGFWPNFTITRPEEPPHVDLDIQVPEVIYAVPGARATISFTGSIEVTAGEYLFLRDLHMAGEAILPDTFGMYVVEKMPAQMTYLSLFTIAQVYFWDEQYNRTLDLFDLAIQRAQEGEISNGLAGAWFSKGYIYQTALGNDQEALKAYDQAIDLDPGFVEAYNNRGIIHAEYGQYDLAFADYNEALRISPEDPELHAGRARAYMGLDDYERAIEDFDYAIAKIQDPIELYQST